MDITKLTMPGIAAELIKDSDIGSLHEKAMQDSRMNQMKDEDGNFVDDFNNMTLTPLNG